MRRRRLLGFGAALLLGAAIGALLWPTVEREWMLRRLFSDVAEQRSRAVFWWSEQPAGAPPPRIGRWPSCSTRIFARLESTEDQATFIDVAALLREAGLWQLPTISTNLWRRRLDLILDSQDGEAARTVLDELAAAEVLRDDANAGQLWGRLLAWPHDASIRLGALRQAAGWFDADAIEALAAAARDDDDPRVRRLAWLLLGHLSPASGYAAVWQGEEPRVAEAMLWAATATNPLDASALLMACDQSPWPTTALPWLLSRSDDEAARQRLEALAIDGHRAAALHLAQRWGVGIEQLPAPQRAWLGGPIDFTEDAALARWSAWRHGQGDPDRLLEDPVAEDGSVWAAVLLAERLLTREAAARRGREWMARDSDEVRSAGAMLLALIGESIEPIRQSYAGSHDESFRVHARLALLMEGERETALPGYAWRVLEAGEARHRLAALAALLAAGDAQAAQAVLTAPSAAPSATMLERAWLIERFLPEYAAVVAPLCPWSDEVAALQFDIMAAAWALRGGAESFDTSGRTFRYTAAATPPR